MVLYTITTIIVILEAYLGFLNHGQMYLENYTSLRPTVLFNTLAALPLGFTLSRFFLKHKWFSQAIKLISRYAFGIFFVHPQVLTGMKILLNIVVGSYINRMIYMIVLIISTLTLSVMFCYLVDRHPLDTILLGDDRKNKTDTIV